MFPKIIEIGSYTVYAYGLFIVLGAAAAYLFLSKNAAEKYEINPDKISTLLIWIIVAAFVGGKLFFYLEDPSRYLSNPSAMIQNLGNGFVFFGSLLFAVPVTIWFFKKEKWNVWGMLDLLAFTTIIVHAIGRMGCFLAGCCHGVPTDSWLGVTFTHPESQAEPLGVPLHPTQLYEIFWLVIVFVALYAFRAKKQFDGQLFLIYVMLYSIGRSVIEVFRGDEERGYIIDNILSHSQLISILLIIATLGTYVWRRGQTIAK